MSQHHSNPDREHEETALPDIEVFYQGKVDFLNAGQDSWLFEMLWNYKAEQESMPLDICAVNLSGWFWHSCFPGCLPDSAPNGPFPDKASALADAQSNND